MWAQRTEVAWRVARAVRLLPAAFPGYPSGRAAMSSLTVARQRGICTRFPIPVSSDGNARTQFLKEPEKMCAGNLIGGQVEVNAGGGPPKPDLAAFPQAAPVPLTLTRNAPAFTFRASRNVKLPGPRGISPSPRSFEVRHLRGELAEIFDSKERIGKIFRTKHLASGKP